MVLQVILLAVISALPSCGAIPSVSIGSPSDGSVSTTRTVNVTGTAAGSEDVWSQTSREDFMNGSRQDVSSDAYGTVTLDRTRMLLYDDFNDDSLDPDKWNWYASGGLNVSETGSELRIQGAADYCWSSDAEIYSTLVVQKSASVDLTSFSGSNFELYFYLFQDYWNNVFFKLETYTYSSNGTNGTNATNTTYTYLYWGYERYGSWDEYYLGNPPAGILNFKIVAETNVTSVYLNNVKKGSAYNQYSQNLSANVRIEARSWGEQAPMDARFDNVKVGDFYSGTGNLSSIVYDTGCTDPVLKAVRWNATLPNATGLSVMVRSSDALDMSAPTTWTAVLNGQTSGLPAVKRFLQYRLALTSADGLMSPSFRDIDVVYGKPVVKVEVSTDEKGPWTPAVGTSSWHVTLELPEMASDIWVRATDVAGDEVRTSIKVEVDTTPPKGSVEIDQDALFTTDRQVDLALCATDRHGVVSMMASEDPLFEGLAWEDFAASLKFKLSDGDGTKTVHVRFLDANGWASAAVNGSILLDTQPPQGAVLIDGGAEYTRNATVTLSLDASDPIGVTGLLASNSPDFIGAQWMEYQRYLPWSLVPGSGERNVYVKYRDAGGHVSQSYHDSILADPSPPSVSVVLNGGAGWTRTPSVSVELSASEEGTVAFMQVREGEGSFPPAQVWAAYQPTFQFELTRPDGTKAVSVRLMDAAGNSGPAATARILLDTSPPATRFSGFPEVSYRSVLPVSWEAPDAGSGAAWTDVQYRVDGGPWTDWLARTCSTSAAFTGEDGRTYSFRARSQDRAGNLEDFPTTVDNSVSFRLTEAALVILGPAEKATLKDKVRISGSCQPDAEGKEPVQVLVRVDDGPWQLAEGTSNWSFFLDTTKLGDGNHVLRVRTFDGKEYSPETERNVTVKNASPRGLDAVPALSAALVIALVAVVALALVLGRRPRGGRD